MLTEIWILRLNRIDVGFVGKLLLCGDAFWGNALAAELWQDTVKHLEKRLWRFQKSKRNKKRIDKREWNGEFDDNALKQERSKVKKRAASNILYTREEERAGRLITGGEHRYHIIEPSLRKWQNNKKEERKCNTWEEKENMQINWLLWMAHTHLNEPEIRYV